MTGTLTPELAIINASLVVDIFPVQCSAIRALSNEKRGCLKAKSLHAELVFGLSGSKHIGDTLSKFGVNESCRNVLVGRFNATAEEIEAIPRLISGQQMSPCDVAALADTELVKKVYKVSPEELIVGDLIDTILCRIAAKID